MSRERTVTRTVKARASQRRATVTITATATPGGAYADLVIGHYTGEVIGLWDYAAGASELDETPGKLGKILDAWIASNNSECTPDWHWVFDYLDA